MYRPLRAALIALPATFLLLAGCGPELTESELKADEATGTGTVEQELSNKCGSGYSLIDTYNMKNSSGTVTGKLKLYYNGYRNCAVAECYGNCGTTMDRVVQIRVSSSFPDWDDTDGGKFAYYAGPVYSKPSAGKCIDLTAYFGVEARVGSANKLGVHCG